MRVVWLPSRRSRYISIVLIVDPGRVYRVYHGWAQLEALKFQQYVTDILHNTWTRNLEIDNWPCFWRSVINFLDHWNNSMDHRHHHHHGSSSSSSSWIINSSSSSSSFIRNTEMDVTNIFMRFTVVLSLNSQQINLLLIIIVYSRYKYIVIRIVIQFIRNIRPIRMTTGTTWWRFTVVPESKFSTNLICVTPPLLIKFVIQAWCVH